MNEGIGGDFGYSHGSCISPKLPVQTGNYDTNLVSLHSWPFDVREPLIHIIVYPPLPFAGLVSLLKVVRVVQMDDPLNTVPNSRAK